eukprot:4262900-Prymnesium_polylepis.1
MAASHEKAAAKVRAAKTKDDARGTAVEDTLMNLKTGLSQAKKSIKATHALEQASVAELGAHMLKLRQAFWSPRP